MRILQINKFYYPWLGGVEKVVQDIAEGLNGQAGLTIDVLACQVRGARQQERINDITVYRAASSGKLLGMPLSWDFFRLLAKLRTNYDAVLIHHPFPLAFLAWPLLKGKPLFIWYHSDIVRQRWSKWLFLPFLKIGLRQATAIFVGSHNLPASSPLLKKYADKCRVIHFGVDLDRFTADAETKEAARKIRQTYGRPLLLSVGRLVPYKGFDYLIKALKADQTPDKSGQMPGAAAKLIIIGAGPEAGRLANLIKRLDLGNRVKIIEPVPDLRPFYAACDLFILPSVTNNEAFGLVQLEAMAYGKPIINTALPTGVSEVSPHNISGLSVPPRDPLALSQAINQILGDDRLRAEFGANARQRVAENFNQISFRQKLLRILLGS
ncbi:MAG: glycosyltransferase [Patescibacteria group bacterium]